MDRYKLSHDQVDQLLSSWHDEDLLHDFYDQLCNMITDLDSVELLARNDDPRWRLHLLSFVVGYADLMLDHYELVIDTVCEMSKYRESDS